ncbi:MAG: hypothetical protein JWP38_3604 [Herbaspirillum sp.]|jgi:hypothetical protein|nr:hypothetical protein [Herbaspirillum sp.]
MITKTLLLSGSVLLTALLATACSTSKPIQAEDQLEIQVCLRDKAMARAKTLDFTIVHSDKRDTDAALAVGTSVKDQPIFEAATGQLNTIKATILSLDRKTWYAFAPPSGVSVDKWSDWQAAGYVTRSEDPAYQLQHDLSIVKDTGATDAVQIRYRMISYEDWLANNASRRLELRHTDFVPC